VTGVASIVSVATALPAHRFRQDELREAARTAFEGKIDGLHRYISVFDTGLIEERYLAVPPDWFDRPRSFGERNDMFIKEATRLGIIAAAECLDRGEVSRRSVDHLIFVSSSGIAAPSVDVEILQALGLSPNVMRIPIFGLGCAAGAAAIRLAGAIVRGDPAATVLIIAVELNSLTFQPDDLTKQNLVAASLFSDGAAAIVVRGSEAGPGVLELLQSFTQLIPRSRDMMGWDVVDNGFKVVFSTRVPQVIGELMPHVLGALGLEGVLDDFVFHPGGRRILEAYCTVLGKDPEAFQSSYDVLRRFGNMSSATVLFVLADRIANRPGNSGAESLLAAFGPGFSAEATRLRWV
jgi:alkylresorcinol/alkylpyrone synthase